MYGFVVVGCWDGGNENGGWLGLTAKDKGEVSATCFVLCVSIVSSFSFTDRMSTGSDLSASSVKLFCGALTADALE